MRKNSVFTAPFTLYLAVCFLLMFSTSASAYIDPSTTTYIIQAVAGIAVAVGAFVTIYWRKAKKKVQDKLHIDGNSKKEVEEEIRFTDNSDKQ